MGDRVKFQAVSDSEFSPVIYGHWSGSKAAGVCNRISARMRGRSDDVRYTAARIVQELIGTDSGNLSFGIWNADKVLSEDDSDGDAGVILVHCNKSGLRFECLGGYLKTDGKTVKGQA